MKSSACLLVFLVVLSTIYSVGGQADASSDASPVACPDGARGAGAVASSGSPQQARLLPTPDGPMSFPTLGHASAVAALWKFGSACFRWLAFNTAGPGDILSGAAYALGSLAFHDPDPLTLPASMVSNGLSAASIYGGMMLADPFGYKQIFGPRDVTGQTEFCCHALILMINTAELARLAKLAFVGSANQPEKKKD